MSKKSNSDKLAKKLEVILSKVDIVMRNGLIVALFLIIDGINFILNPEATIEGMARNIILLALIAALSIFVANLTAKTRNKKTVILSAIVVVIGIILFIFPSLIAAYIQIILAVFIIYNGVSNIAKALNLNKLSNFVQNIAGKISKISNRKKPAPSKEKAERIAQFKEVNKSVNSSMEEQAAKLINPLKGAVDKASKFSALYIIANIVSIIIGIMLLILPEVSMTVWGILFIYTGIPNLLAAAKSMQLIQKVKEKKFKEILYGDEKSSKNPTKNKKPMVK